MNGQVRIESLFAFVATDKDGTEGVISVATPSGHMPLVGADTARAESLKPFAKMAAEQAGVEVKLLHFTNREEVETL